MIWELAGVKIVGWMDEILVCEAYFVVLTGKTADILSVVGEWQ